MADTSSTSLAGLGQQTSEPSDIASLPSKEPSTVAVTPKLTRDSSTSSLNTKRLLPLRVASATSSPIPSRESSPVRPGAKAASTRTGRSRKNSANDIIPSRSTSANTNPPSAAAQQRALSVASIPTLKPATSDPPTRAAAPQKPSVTSELPKETPRWPTSPRLRSPPPVGKQAIPISRKLESDPPAINVQKSSWQVPEQQEPEAEAKDHELDESLAVPGMRTPVRSGSNNSSALETVQEVSQPNTPGNGLDGLVEKGDYGFTQEHVDTAMGKATKPKANNESGSESGGKSSIKMKHTNPSHVNVTRPPATKYSSNTSAGRGKPSGEGSMQTMTIETETVSSIPQVAMVSAGGGNNGSIRAKPSSETIRPKKDKKKTTRKTPSVASGTASSKADIFEAKVASAVDEANSSDSEETFVYESNPPDVQDRPRRFHSRTPSATSMASQVDQRSRSMMDHGHSVAMKKSMKFANTYNTNTPEAAAGEDDGKGTTRSNAGTGRGTAHHHHHIGRWGRNNGNGHASLFDNESPFPNVTKTKLSGNNQRHSSRPSSPRVLTPKVIGNGKKSPIVPYDTDDIADDERQPLMSSIRSGRSGRTRRPASSRQWEYQASRHNHSFLGRYAGCIVLSLVILLVSLAAIAFMLATTQPLSEVKVLALKNVLASEQDVIFDMKVEARNPNVVAVSIDRTNLVIFAKSKYAGTDSQYWNRPQARRWLRWGQRKSDDDSTQTPDGDDEDPDAPTYPNLEIGHVFGLESSLSFNGAPFHHAHSESVGQIRITNPGNHTTPAGSERWGRVLQHEFDLIVRGTLKYTLPFSQRIQSISVEGRVTVKPNAADSESVISHIS